MSKEKKMLSALKELRREFAVVVEGKVVEFTIQDIVDLIHRLQDENKRLKDEKEEIRLFSLAIQNGEVDMRIESEMAKSFYNSIIQVFEQNGAKNFFTTTIDIEGKKGRYAFTIEKVGGQTVAEKLAEQKAEIERMTEEIDGEGGFRDTLKQVHIKKHELEEQVRDLKEWKKACYGYKHAAKQAVKDTAKEIITELDHLIPNTHIVISLKKRYGVEVE